MVEPRLERPCIEIERRVEWFDTDASGHQHYSAILRWVEAAETDFLKSVQLERLFGSMPRVRIEVNYRGRLWFGDPVTVKLWVSRLGQTSLHFGFEVFRKDVVVADGLVVTVHSQVGAGPAPWPPDVRSMLGFPLD